MNQFDDSLDAPFVERLTGAIATIVAVKLANKLAQLPMRSTIWCDTKAHWSPEALAKRAVNRKLYMDTKYPETKLILIGD